MASTPFTEMLQAAQPGGDWNSLIVGLRKQFPTETAGMADDQVTSMLAAIGGTSTPAGAVTANPLMAQKFATQRETVTPPAGVTDPKYPAWKKSQDQADQFMLGIDVAGAVAPGAVPAAKLGVQALKEAPKRAVSALEGYMAKQGMIQPMDVWHGSPHKFDAFDAGKIGTGEGAQAYGHGIYTAENPSVAHETLRHIMTNDPGGNVAYKVGDPKAFEAMKAKWFDATSKMNNATTREGMLAAREEASLYKMKLEEMHQAAMPPGNIYKVDLPDEMASKMLDWDKPLSAQPETLKKLQESDLGKPYMWNEFSLDPSMTAQKMYARLSYELGRGSKGEAAAAKKLNELGIPGIRYWDGGSRAAGEGTSNFVVFPGNEQALRILERTGGR